MSINALSSAISGLASSQTNIDVISNNIANVDTDGYTRKTAEQSSVAVDFSGVGVRVERVTRYVDQKLLRDFRLQNSIESYLNTRSSYLEPIASFHGNPELESNLHGQLSQLKSAFSDLTSQSNSSIIQRDIVNIAARYAETFNNYSDMILKARQKAENEIKAITDEINSALKTIEMLNRRISPKKLTGEDTAELEDQRDLAVKELSKYMEVTYFEDGKGFLVVQTNKGHVMVDQTAQQVSFQPSTITHASSYPQNLNGVVLTQGSASSLSTLDLASFNVGGELGALFELRDQDLLTYQAFADELAHKTAQRFDTYGLRLFTNRDGVVPPDDPTQYYGFAASIEVNSRIVTDPTFIQRGTDPANGNLDSGSNEVINRVIDDVFGTDPIATAVNTVTTVTPAATPLSNQILANNPIAYWRLDETSGTTAVNMGSLGASVNGTYGTGTTLNNATLYPNGGNNSAQFDGINGLISIPDNAAINLNTVPQRTIELVFNADTVAGRQILYEEGATVNSIAMYIDNGNLYVASNDSGEWGPFNINTPIVAGQTYHASLVLDTTGSGTFTGYLDGVAFGSGATPTSLDPHSGDIGIGGINGGVWFHDGPDGSATGYNFQGRISDVALYNGALTAAELLNHANSLTAVATTTTTTTGGVAGTTNFRTENLGFFADINLNTNGTNISLMNFAQAFILRQTGAASTARAEISVESSYKNDIQKRLLDSSAVDMDEELGRLIQYRQSYGAASQMIVTLDEMFQDLLSNV